MAATGKSMILDVQRSASGNVVVNEDGSGAMALPGDERPRYVTHWSTCPFASTHRKAKR